MSEREGEAATPLNAEETAAWGQAKHQIDALVGEVMEGVPVEVTQARVEKMKAIEVDMARVLNAIHVPKDAGVRAAGLEKILRRIPDGWGRWVSCSSGWYGLLVELDEKLRVLDPDYGLHQVKEKYGTLRYYCSPSQGVDDEVGLAMEEAVGETEAKAACTCEICGDEGQLMAKGGKAGGWYRTLCDLDAEKHGYAPLTEEGPAIN